MHKVSVNEACQLAKISRPTFYKYINNGTLSVVKEGKSTHVELVELIRVFPDIKLEDGKDEVKNLQSLTAEIAHKDEIIEMLKRQLSEKQQDNEFLKNQLTQVNENFTTVNKFLEDKTNKKRKKVLGIF